MNITQNNIDELNAVLTVTIDKSDYRKKVDDSLKNYRKNADIPGFRKGHVPMGLIKKQYEMPLIFDEVNRLIQTSVNGHLTDNKLAILGDPLPVADENLDWNADSMDFKFELGLSPKLEINLEEASVPYYQINVTDEEVNKYIENFQRNFGKVESTDEVADDSILKGVFHQVNQEGEIDENEEHYHASFRIEDLKDSASFLGKKAEDRVETNAQDLFKEKGTLANILGVTAEEAEAFDKKLSFKINEISAHTPAEINQELFDKVYGEGTVDSEEAFREKVKEESAVMYEGEADKVFLSSAIMKIEENTTIDLPKEFLKKWINSQKETPIEADALEEEYNKSEKGLRMQLIYGKISEDFNIRVEPEDMEKQAVKNLRQQMKMYGMGDDNLSEDMLKGFTENILNDEQQSRQIADQIFSEKLLVVIKDKVKKEIKEVSFDEFIEEVKKQNEQLSQEA